MSGQRTHGARRRAGAALESKSREVGVLAEQADASLLEIVDHVLNKGVVIQGEVVLGVASVDLVYVRLSAVLCAADRVLGNGAGKRNKVR